MADKIIKTLPRKEKLKEIPKNSEFNEKSVEISKKDTYRQKKPDNH